MIREIIPSQPNYGLSNTEKIDEDGNSSETRCFTADFQIKRWSNYQ